MDNVPVSVKLRRSMPMDFRLFPDAPEVIRFVRSIVGDRAKGAASLRVAVAFLVLNFLRLRYSDPRRLLAVSSNRNFYSGRTVSFGAMRGALEVLEGVGLAEEVAKGYFDKAKMKGRVARWQGTARLFELAAEAGMRSTMIQSKGPERLIELRAPKKKPARKSKAAGQSKGKAKRVRLCHWPRKFRLEKKQMEQNLRTINQALKGAFIALNVTDGELESIQEQLGKKHEEVKYIDFFDKSLHRVFNDGDPQSGGRFYGGFWQAVPRKYRERIWIAAPGRYPAHTIELDFSHLHPLMLYAQVGAPLTRDPYELYNDPKTNKAARPVVKRLFLAMINAASKTAALKAARKSFVDAYDTEWVAGHPGEKRPSMNVDEMLPEGCPALAELVNKIETRHSEIKEKFYDPTIGKQLMFRDSQIAEAVMLRMINEVGTVVLPIHDSFIVRKGYDSDLNRIMEQEFHRLIEASIKTKQPTSALGRWPGDGAKDSQRLTDVFDTTDLLEGRKPSPRSVYETLMDDWNMTHKLG